MLNLSDTPVWCRRNRAIPVGESTYNVDADSLSIQDHGCQMDLVNSAGPLQAEIFTLQDNMFRLKIKEKNGLHPRYEVEGALVGEPKLEK